MYGTVARLRLKSGMDQKMGDLIRSYEALKVDGHIRSTLYRMDEESNELYLAVVFENKEKYDKNANSPEQDKRYHEMLDLLDREPEWHDGEIIYSGP